MQTEPPEPGAPPYVAIGHVCVDELVDAPPRLGGTVFFSSAQAATMGCRVTVVTSCTPDVATDAAAALPAGTALQVHDTGRDTRFGFGPDAADGPQRLLSVAAPIDSFATEGRPDILHLAPVFNELTPNLVATARERARFVGATPQGLLRGTDADGGLVFLADNWPERRDFADAIVLNDEEYAHLHGIGLLDRFDGLVFRTLGPAGAALVHHGDEIARHELDPDQRPVPPRRTIGAGDVFAAAAFVSLARGDSPAAALRIAVASATGYVRRPTDAPTFVAS